MRSLNFNFQNKYFIETGLERGDGLQMALDSGVFEKLFSIEINPTVLFVST